MTRMTVRADHLAYFRGAHMSFLNSIGTWFGYVGSCVASPDATCRPFLAFVALGVAAAAALTLMVIAYRKDHVQSAVDIEERRTRERTREMQDRVRRTLAGQPVAPKPTSHGRFPAAA
jgi:hypothetical protein